MSDFRGLHNPDWHDSVGVRAWCRCGTWCSEDAECDCCELVELRAEFERLTARAEAAEAEVERLTEALAERDQKIADALAYCDDWKPIAFGWKIERILRGES